MTQAGKTDRSVLLSAAAAALALLGALLLLPGGSSTATPASSPTRAQPSSAAGSAGTAPAPTRTSPAIGAAPRGDQDAREDAGEHGSTWAPGQEPWRPVATGFVTDFTQPGPDWVTRVTRWTSDYLTTEYTQLDPVRVPAANLVDVQMTETEESIADIVASYDNGLVLLVRVEDSMAGWKVTRVQPADDLPAPRKVQLVQQ